MNYTFITESYNERRYGRPWMAIITDLLTKNFTFLEWDGRPGHAGEFNFEAEPGTLLAFGQKDVRKGRGGVDGYRICLPDGSIGGCGDEAAALHKLSPAQRWQAFARQRLDAATGAGPGLADWRRAGWISTRGAIAAKYSRMLGVADPLMLAAAEALDLVSPAVSPATDVASGDMMAAFGL